MTGVILAAGLSSRLRPLTETVSKSMLKIGGRYSIEYIIRLFSLSGISRIYITTHYKADQIRNTIGDGTRFGVNITYSHEAEPLGTAGSLKQLKDHLDEDFMVAGSGYVLPTLDLSEAIKMHQQYEAVATLILHYMADKERCQSFGQTLVDEGGKVIRFAEKPESFVSNLVHTSYQILSPAIFDHIPDQLPYAIPNQLLPDLMAKGKRVQGYVTGSDLLYLSTPETYKRADLMANQIRQLFWTDDDSLDKPSNLNRFEHEG